MRQQEAARQAREVQDRAAPAQEQRTAIAGGDMTETSKGKAAWWKRISSVPGRRSTGLGGAKEPGIVAAPATGYRHCLLRVASRAGLRQRVPACFPPPRPWRLLTTLPSTLAWTAASVRRAARFL
jgi:hypothetical protein